jgi:membrane protein YdbS with pleckstrin-like domain
MARSRLVIALTTVTTGRGRTALPRDRHTRHHGYMTELRAPAHLVSRRARWYWTARAAVGWIVVGGITTFVLVVADFATPVGVIVAVLVGVVALLHLLVMPQWRYRVHRWELTDTAAYTQAGWLRQERRIAPIVRIQTVDTERGPFEQLFGLANVTATTASAKGPIKIDALDRSVAEHAVAWLTDRAQASGGDGT